MANDITIRRGDDHTISIDVDIDITGYTFFFTVKSKTDNGDDDANAIIAKEVTSHTDAAAGQTQFLLTDVDTNVDIWDYDYDIQYKTPAGLIQTFITGDFIITKDITRRTS